MTPDTFFTKTNCDRCNQPLEVRTMSWFTTETICMECSKKEDEIKTKLKQKNLPDAEGCGFIPTI
jgi:hypothetical protein